jgi:hypothetical protein
MRACVCAYLQTVLIAFRAVGTQDDQYGAMWAQVQQPFALVITFLEPAPTSHDVCNWLSGTLRTLLPAGSCTWHDIFGNHCVNVCAGVTAAA